MKSSVVLGLTFLMLSISLQSHAEVYFGDRLGNTKPRLEDSKPDVPGAPTAKASVTYAWQGSLLVGVVAVSLREMRADPSWQVDIQYTVTPGPESPILTSEGYDTGLISKPDIIQFTISGTPTNVRDALLRLKTFWSVEHKIVKDPAIILDMTRDIETLGSFPGINKCGLF